MKFGFISYVSLLSIILSRSLNKESIAGIRARDIIKEYKNALYGNKLPLDSVMSIYNRIDHFLDEIEYYAPEFKSSSILEPMYAMNDRLTRSIIYVSEESSNIEALFNISGLFKFSLFLASYVRRYYEDFKSNCKTEEAR